MKLIITNAIVVVLIVVAVAVVVGVNCCLLYLVDTFYKAGGARAFCKTSATHSNGNCNI